MFDFFFCLFLFVFFFDPGRGCLFFSAPLSSLVIPRKERTQRTTLRQITDTSPAECTRKFWAISDFTGKHSIIWPQPRKFCKNVFFLKKIRFTKIYEGGFCATPTNSNIKHGTSPKIPIFPGFFSTRKHQRSHTDGSRAQSLVHTKAFFLISQ